MYPLCHIGRSVIVDFENSVHTLLTVFLEPTSRTEWTRKFADLKLRGVLLPQDRYGQDLWFFTAELTRVLRDDCFRV